MNAALLSQALAFRADSCLSAKRTLGAFGMPFNAVEEGVTYDGDVDGTVHFRLYFPNAKKVTIAVAGSKVSLIRNEDGAWTGQERFPTGLQCLFILVDDQEVCSPYLPFAYNFCRPVNYIDVPPPDQRNCLYAMRGGIAYGTVAHDLFPTTEGAIEPLLIYLPPSYRKAQNVTRRYPVLYLQHGMGENENGWVQHGKLNVIADNLIADRRMTECIIVMANGLMHTEAGELDAHGYTRRLVTDVIPYIDANYRTYADRHHRAMAGLSMGSFQATCITMQHPELFTSVGIFSGFLRLPLGKESEEEASYFANFRKDPGAYRAAMKLVFRAIGDQDVFLPRFDEESEILDSLDFKEDVRRVYAGQAHCWQVWRMCAIDFLPLLFADDSR